MSPTNGAARRAKPRSIGMAHRMTRMRSASSRSSLPLAALQIRVAPDGEIHVTDFGRFDGVSRLYCVVEEASVIGPQGIVWEGSHATRFNIGSVGPVSQLFSLFWRSVSTLSYGWIEQPLPKCTRQKTQQIPPEQRARTERIKSLLGKALKDGLKLIQELTDKDENRAKKVPRRG